MSRFALLPRLLLLAVSVCLGAGAALLMGAGSASAHAHLESISPADGASLSSPPTKVVLTFDEPVTKGLSVIAVKSASGTNVAQGDPEQSGPSVTQQLSADLPAGTYTIAWKAVSDDGHPVSGTAAFTTGAGGTETSPSSTSTSSAPVIAPTSSGSTSAPAAASGASSTTKGGGSSGLLWIIILALLVFGVLGLTRARRRQRLAGGGSDGAPGGTDDGPASGPSDRPGSGTST